MTNEVRYLTDTQAATLERDLNDLPDLTDQLARHYHHLLARGEKGGDQDPAARYPTKFAILDLADQRWKQYCPGRTCPGCPECDPAGEADLARRIGARRQGILPTLTTWVSNIVGQLPDGALELQPTDPATQQPTIAGEAFWLQAHLPTITGLPIAPDFANDIRSIVRDLEEHVGPAYARPAPDSDILATETELVDRLKIPRGTISWWITSGRLQQARHAQRHHPLTNSRGHRLYFIVEADALKTNHKPTKVTRQQPHVTHA